MREKRSLKENSLSCT